jgi:hypothetical protein
MHADSEPDSMAVMRTGCIEISRLENAGRRHRVVTRPAWVVEPSGIGNGDDLSGEMISCAPRMSATEVRLEEVVTRD